jgi:hypothetical protein
MCRPLGRRGTLLRTCPGGGRAFCVRRGVTGSPGHATRTGVKVRLVKLNAAVELLTRPGADRAIEPSRTQATRSPLSDDGRSYRCPLDPGRP